MGTNSDNVVDLFETSAQVTKLGKDHGFGFGKQKTGSGQDMVSKLVKVGAISSETKQTIIRGIKARNVRAHSYTGIEPISKEECDKFSNAKSEVEEVLKKGFSEEF